MSYLDPDIFSPHLIPRETLAGIQRYISDGIRPGSFVQAVLSNDLHEAVRRADRDNAHALAAIVGWLHNNAPANCWGCPDLVEAWIRLHAERLAAGLPGPDQTEPGDAD